MVLITFQMFFWPEYDNLFYSGLAVSNDTLAVLYLCGLDT